MSDLSELLKTTKNIEKQNAEIMRLLKKIAGEDEEDEKSRRYKELLSYTPDFGDLHISGERKEKEIEKTEIENPYKIGDMLENSIDVGEVYFLEGVDIYKLSIKNNETVIDNLTGDGEASEFSLQELVANESVKNNVSLADNSVVLSSQQCQNLPETLRICVEQNAKKLYIPLYSSAQLVGAPQRILNLVKFDFYKTEEELLEKLFK
ncbi:hypothetical protein [Methanobrevibacter sp.]|uniref:hypothetical protein n=1 Tax=Methanobrevibacter sp. TaxID=66852 RepID=UPI00388E5F36